MRSRTRKLFLIISFLCLCNYPPATYAKVFLPLVHSQDSMKEKATDDHQESSTNKLAHGVTGGGTSGHDPSPSGGDTNGGPHSTTGGAAVIPLYAAGSGNNHHNHHGGGNGDKSRIGHATLAITAVVCFVLCNLKDW